MELSERIRALRQNLGLTQEDFARRIGTSQKVVSRWENGVRPRDILLRRIAEVGKVPYQDLAHGMSDSTGTGLRSLEENRLLEAFRAISSKRLKYEIMARIRNSEFLLMDSAALEKRTRIIFFDQSDDMNEAIAHYLTRRFRDLYDELVEIEAERDELQEEAEAGNVGRDVIANLAKRADHIRERIAKLRRFNRDNALEALHELDDGDIRLEVLLEELERD
jgi:transcriptional regulator with XRE-family HTH domain